MCINYRLCLICSCVILLIAGAAWAQGNDVNIGYRVPKITVPYAWQVPAMDGVVQDAEWQQATSIDALQNYRNQISPRQTRFWMMWDEGHLYVAMRSPLRSGERVIQAYRNRGKDVNVVFDDSYELWFDLGTHSPDGQPVFFQYLANFAGVCWDAMHEPAVGNMRLGWTAGWEPKSRILPDGSAWELELAIPRESMYKMTPFTDGFAFTCLFARNFKRPWEQNFVAGAGMFSSRDAHTQAILSRSAPAVHLLAVAGAQHKSLGLHLAGYSREEGAIRWRFASDSGVVKDGHLELKAGMLETMPSMMGFDSPGAGNYRITVTTGDGKTNLLDWCAKREFGNLAALSEAVNDAGDSVSLSLEYNPVSSYVRVTGDFINYDARGAIAKCRAAVRDARGKTVTSHDLKLDSLAYVRGVVKLGELAPGEYVTTMTCLDKEGNTVLTRENSFTKKDLAKEFPWWNTKAGSIERVISPWTPVTYRDGVMGVWGRRMTVGASGLPAQIVSLENKLLARPMALVARMANGKTVIAREISRKVITRADHRAVVRVESRLGDIRVSSLVTVEFDGMYKIDMTIDPRQTAKIKSLQVVAPLKNEVAEYLHAAGEGIRYGYDYRFLPKNQKGRIWDSRKVDSQPMLVGSFFPYLWVGNPQGGLCWFADSDAGWTPSGTVPAIEIRHDKPTSTDLILNLISEPCTLDAPRTIVFAFQASPVKPMHAQWRMDSWWCGDTFKDYAQVEPKGGSLIFTSVPFTLDTNKCREMVEAQHKGVSVYNFGVGKYQSKAVPYFEHIAIGGGFAPEVSYFGDEWRTSVSRGLYYGKTFTDFMIHNYSKWAKDTGIDGFYFDNVNPLADDNIDAGRGYRLPDGRIQPTYQIFDTRKYFLRVRAAFAEQGRHNKIVIHMTNNMILPWVGAGDIAYDGEDHNIFPESGKDFMDLWPLERLRADYPAQWGAAVNFMHEYSGTWEPQRMAKVMRAYTGMVILHDALPSGNSNGQNVPLWIARDRFGIEGDDVRFIGYWDKDSGVGCSNADVCVSAWRRPGRVMLAVVNRGEQADVTVNLDRKKLGLAGSAPLKITDLEAGTKIDYLFAHGHLADSKGAWVAPTDQAVLAGNGKTLTVNIARHDYRLVMLEAQ